MLKYHEVIRPIAFDNFYEQSIDLWLSTNAGHMGAQMYQHHNGKKNGTTISGVYTWDQHAKNGTLPAYNEEVLDIFLPELSKSIETGLPVIEFGPGSMDDAKAIIHAVDSNEYIPVDCTLEVIKSSQQLADELPSCTVRPSVTNFFSKDNCPLIDKPALGIFLGGTVANIPGPVPSEAPKDILIATFRNLIKSMPQGGFLLISVDTCEDKKRNTTLYNEPWHKLFGVNHLYRMNEELPMQGFDPDGFEYKPVWHEHCGLLAHTVIATQNQNFKMGLGGEISISVKEGDIFHYNNSFKYNRSFFEACAKDAGLEVIRSRQGQEDVYLYLFAVPHIEEQKVSKIKLLTKAA